MAQARRRLTLAAAGDVPDRRPNPRELRIAGAAGVRVHRLIASSSHASVLAGRSAEGRVVLKVASERTLTDPLGRARFAREGRVGLHLEHPSLVRTLRHGEDWIVTRQLGAPREDALRGGECESPAPTLADRVLAAGPLAAAEVERVIAAVAGALAHMHAKGFVHRDVKPGNVLVAEAPAGKAAPGEVSSGGRWILVDLGAVGFTGGDGLDAAEIIGSPAWMAPEQIDGCAAHPGLDSWSLAMVAVHALAGRGAYEGIADDILRRRREDDICRRFAAKAAAGVRSRFAVLIASALSADPRSRPPARDFARLPFDDPAEGAADWTFGGAHSGR